MNSSRLAQRPAQQPAPVRRPKKQPRPIRSILSQQRAEALHDRYSKFREKADFHVRFLLGELNSELSRLCLASYATSCIDHPLHIDEKTLSGRVKDLVSYWERASTEGEKPKIRFPDDRLIPLSEANLQKHDPLLVRNFRIIQERFVHLQALAQILENYENEIGNATRSSRDTLGPLLSQPKSFWDYVKNPPHRNYYDNDAGPIGLVGGFGGAMGILAVLLSGFAFDGIALGIGIFAACLGIGTGLSRIGYALYRHDLKQRSSPDFESELSKLESGFMAIIPTFVDACSDALTNCTSGTLNLVKQLLPGIGEGYDGYDRRYVARELERL
ncbi:hypothetical protein HY988_04285, partial [Candidatus Micrarchaeota archaeon]|nr:hypothetical protein [Candidatus Micrarchaeota archaeon]